MQTSSGDLLAVLSRHFRPVSCIRFSDDGSRLVSASRDGQVLAWDLGDAVSSTHGTGEPLHVWAQHSFDVTDVWLGLGGGARCRVYTCSLDQTCRAYAMDSGELLATAVLDAPLTALAADPAEDHLFAAANTGKIYQASSLSFVLQLSCHYWILAAAASGLTVVANIAILHAQANGFA